MANESASELRQIDVDPILEKLREILGVDFTEYRRSTITRRLQRRLALTRCEDETQYLSLLDRDPKESEALLHELTIKFSEFYRDPALWEFLISTALPEVVRRKADDFDPTIRVWTAGAATGEETYTVAMVLDAVVRTRSVVPNIEIVATDLDAEALKRACEGEYSDTSLRKLPEWYLPEYFDSDKTHKVKDTLKSHITFRQDNLLNPPPSDGSLEGFDLVFCRNVLIYLTRPLQLRVFERLARALRPHGLLILGTAEVVSASLEARFRELNRGLRVLQLKP